MSMKLNKSLYNRPVAAQQLKDKNVTAAGKDTAKQGAPAAATTSKASPEIVEKSQEVAKTADDSIIVTKTADKLYNARLKVLEMLATANRKIQNLVLALANGLDIGSGGGDAGGSANPTETPAPTPGTSTPAPNQAAPANQSPQAPLPQKQDSGGSKPPPATPDVARS